jgi:hypothetical protein
MNKEEIIRICTAYNSSHSYTRAYNESLNLGLVNEVIFVLQENIPSVPGHIANAWSKTVAGISRIAYLEEVSTGIPSAELRIVSIQKASKGTAVSFSFDFDFSNVPDPGIKVNGIKILSFGLTFTVTERNTEPRIRKLVITREKRGRNMKTRLYRKAS